MSLFDNKFIVMKNVVGTPARGDSFFPRAREVRLILSRLKDGNNLNIAAPRRIGKTSILFHLLDNSVGDYLYVYVDTEAVASEGDFYKKILKAIAKVEEVRRSRRLKDLFSAGHQFLGKIKSIKIAGQGIDFVESDSKEIDYQEDLMNLLLGIELEEDRQLVLLIDEFPQTIQNIVDAAKGDAATARQFLQSVRALRLDPVINAKVRFVFTGSIGLNYTVAEINCSAFVNDLNSIEVAALARDEARLLLNKLLKHKKLSIKPELAEYLFDKLEWLIPFHIQLAAQEISMQLLPEGEITKASIDKVFEDIIQARNNNHFDHYYSRLKRRFKGDEFRFAIELLERLSEDGILTKAQIIDLSAKFDQEERWRAILEILEYDGYLSRIDGTSNFRFNSPLVRMWWKRYICK